MHRIFSRLHPERGDSNCEASPEMADEDDGTREENLLLGDYTYAVSKLALSAEPLLRLKEVTEQLGERTLNECERKKIENVYQKVMIEVLSCLTLENASMQSVTPELRPLFLTTCQEMASNINNVAFWNKINPDISDFMEDHAEPVGNLMPRWRRHLELLHFYSSSQEEERQLLHSIEQWLLSPNLSPYWYKKWLLIYENSKNSNTNRILLLDLTNNFGTGEGNASKQDDNRLYENFKLALRKIATAELTVETSQTLYKYVQDIFYLEQSDQGQKRLTLRQKVMLLSSLDIPSKITKQENNGGAVSEIALFAQHTLIVDCNLHKEYMHGKNLMIAAGTIVICYANIVFDVSGMCGCGNEKKGSKSTSISDGRRGKDEKSGGLMTEGQVRYETIRQQNTHNCHERRENTETVDVGKEGRKGANGNAGESSGNIAIIAGKMKNEGNLTVRLIGGNGEGGQNGGQGGSGEEGKGVTREDIDALCVKYNRIFWGDHQRFKNHAPRDGFIHRPSTTRTENGKFFFVNNFDNKIDGRRIEFSMAEHTMMGIPKYDLYFLVRGGTGRPAGAGGQQGLGGGGGRCGEFINFCTSTKQPFSEIEDILYSGRDGQDGEKGAVGHPGRNGNDMVMIDRSDIAHAKHYIGSAGKKIGLVYHNSDAEMRRLNGLRKYQHRENACFVEFTTEAVEDIPAALVDAQHVESNNNERAQSQSKETILLQQVLDEFIRNNTINVPLFVQLRFETDSSQRKVSDEDTVEETITILRTRPEDSRKEYFVANTINVEALIARVNALSGNEAPEYLEEIWNDVFNVHLADLSVIEKLDQVLKLMAPGSYRRIEQNWKDKKAFFRLRTPAEIREVEEDDRLVDNVLLDVMEAPLSDDWKTWNSKQYMDMRIDPFMDQVENYYCHSEDVLNALRGIQTALQNETVVSNLENEVDWEDKNEVLNYFKQSRMNVGGGIQGRSKKGANPGQARRRKIEDVNNHVGAREDHPVHGYHEDLKRAVKGDIEYEALLSFQTDFRGNTTEIGFDVETLIFIFFHSKKLIKLNDTIRRYCNAEITTLLPGKRLNDAKMSKDFVRQFLENGINSIGYLYLLADTENITIEVFVKRSATSMLRILAINEGMADVHRLLFTEDGIPSGIIPHANSQRLRALISNCCSPDILLPDSESLTEFVHPSESDLIKFWTLSTKVILNSSELTRLLRRCFELSGSFLTHVEVIFVLNSCMDLVCNHGVSLASMLDFLASSAFKNLANWMLKLRMLSNGSDWTWKPKFLEQISDGPMSAILGSRLHEVNWSDFNDTFELLVKFLSDSSVSFNQLEKLHLEELFALSADHKTTDYAEIRRRFGHLAYYIAILRLRGKEGKVTLVENFTEKLLQDGMPVLAKSVAFLTYLKYTNENSFGAIADLMEVLKLSSEKTSERLQIASEQAQQARIFELRQEKSWKEVFPEKDRSLEEIGQLSANNDFTKGDMDQIVAMLKNGEEDVVKKLNEIDDVIFEKKQIKLRHTQKIAILCGYLHQRNLVSQVVTGEGKTLIIVALSILYITLDGKNVDVITSSSVLAKRDAHDYQNIYEKFGIRADHNCEEDIEIRKHSYAADIVYGDVAHFERDFLLHFYYQKNVLGKRERKSTIAIVDEVDSMLLDHGSNMLYLSHNVTGLEMLEPLYVFIHKIIETTLQGEDTVKSLTERIKKEVLMDLFGLLTKADIRNLDVTSEETTFAWNILLNHQIVDCNGVVQCFSNDRLRQLAGSLVTSCGSLFAQRILALLSVIKERKKSINIPGYLREFAMEHLDDFVASAIKARLMKKNDEYVVDVDRTQRSVDLHPVVTIIDKGTGTDLRSSQWTNGLHQFLQIANGCRVTPLSLKAVFISNVTFLKGYGKINGLSGTLGSKEERKCLKELYDADVMRIPTCKPRMFAEDVPVIAHSEEEWVRRMYESVKDKLLADRSVLIICSSINDVDKLSKDLPKLCKEEDSDILKAFEEAQTYRRDIDDFHIEQNGLRCGRLIISTNLAGRGTDIKLCEELQHKGGLHVIVGLCDNQRIEDQAFGRAARCGDYGSGQIIALAQERTVVNIFSLKKQRDLEEQKRLRSLKKYYDYHISIEEECLKLFMEHCKELLKLVHTQDDHSSLPAIKYFALLDIWALQLDRISEEISSCEDSGDDNMKRKIVEDVEILLQTFDLDVDGTTPPEWMVRPQPLLHCAVMMMENEKYDEAVDLLHRIAKGFPDFAGEAFYYLGAFVQQRVRQMRDFRRVGNRNGWLGTIQDRNDDVQFFLLRQLQDVVGDVVPSLSEVNNAKRDEATTYLLMAKAEFMRRMEREAQMCSTVVQLHGNGSAGGYRAQKQEAIAVWEAFVDTVDRILGKHASNNALKEDDESEEMAVTRRKILTHAGILTPPVLQDVISRDHLMRIAQKHSLPLSALKQLIHSIQNDNSIAEYEGRQIVDIQVLTRLSLPNAVEFWGCLQKAGVFSQERKYLAVKKGAIKKTEHMSDREKFSIKQGPLLLSDWKKCTIALGPLDVQLHTLYSDDFDFYPLNDVRRIEDIPDLNSFIYLLTSAGLAYIQTIGTINPLVVLKDVQLDKFDFITSSILMNEMGLACGEANWILTKLVDKGILEVGRPFHGESRYILKRRLDFSMFPEPMQESLWTVFTRNFSYGYALKSLKANVKELPNLERISCELPLASSPYSELCEDLIASGILVQSRVSSTLKQYKESKKKTGYWSRQLCSFMPAWLYQKLEPLSPNLTENKCMLEKTHKYMTNHGITSCATLRNAISNGLPKVAYVDRRRADSWLLAVIYKTISCLLTTKLRFFGKSQKKFVAVEAKVGTSHFYMEMIKANQKGYAGTDATFEEEFVELRNCYQEASHVMIAHLRHSKKLEAAQTMINGRIKEVKSHILSHCIVTDSKEKVSTMMFSECVQKCDLLPMLEESIESFMMLNVRESLVDILKASSDNCDSELGIFEPLHSVIAFARAVVFGVEKWMQSLHHDDDGEDARITPEVVRIEIVNRGITAAYAKRILMSEDDSLQSVLAKELHKMLEKMVDSILQSKVQPMVHKMIQSWAEEGAPSITVNPNEEGHNLTEDIEEKELSIRGRHPYLFRDLYNIFLKLTFREQNPAVVAHMVKYNFPLGTHCAGLVSKGIVRLLHRSNYLCEQIKLTLKQYNEKVYTIKWTKKVVVNVICELELHLEQNCFFSGSDITNKYLKLENSLFEELKRKVPEISKEYPEEKVFLIALSSKISSSENHILEGWNFAEEWERAEKLRCAVKL